MIMRDERFIQQGIEELSVEYASQVHVADFELMKERDEQSATYRNKMQFDDDSDDSNDSSTNSSQRSTCKFPLQDCSVVMIDSFDLLLKGIIEKMWN
jgi:hypothetical protein